MPTDQNRLRPVEDTLAGAVAGALTALPLMPEDQGARKLALQYAQQIDGAEDPAKALEVLGPKLLAVLESLGATPGARARVVKAVSNGGPSRLDLIREARRP